MAIIHCDKAERVADILPPESVQTVVTSPPYYGLRDYGVEGQIGLEATPEEYVAKLVEVFRGIRQVLRPDGTVWLNLGDSYCSGMRSEYDEDRKHPGARAGQHRPPSPVWAKPKDLLGIPWRVAFALQADGWYLRSDIIWHKPNAMPESVTDRPTKAHEYIFLLSKSPRYYYDAEAIKEPLARPEELLRKTPAVFGGRNKHEGYGTRKHSGNEYVGTYTGRNRRSVWTIATQPFPEAHFATFPEKLPELCILAGSSPQACPKCRAPWERVVERIAGVSKECPKTQAAHEARGGTGKPSGTVGKSGGGRIDSISRTIGWQPTCSCPDNDGSGKCIVLDPFAGSGTTLLVAERFGRQAVGIEINPEYVEMAKRRLSKVQLAMSF